MKSIMPAVTTSKGGHYSPGIISNGLIFVSGQLPFDPFTEAIVMEDIHTQTLIALQNVESIIKTVGAKREAIVMCRIYISNIAYWQEVDKAYCSFFGNHKPARIIVPCGDLHYGSMVEVEAIAEI